MTVDRPAMTPLSASYRAALGTAAAGAVLRRPRPRVLPARTVVVRDHRIDAGLAARYAWLLHRHGEPLNPQDLPSVLVHVAVFPAAMELMAAEDFPLPLLGMVHLENHVVHHAAVPSGEPLTVTASATRLEPHPSGTSVDLVVTVHGPGEDGGRRLLWEGTSTYLAAGVHLAGRERPPRSGHPTFEAPVATQRWSLPASTGRDYAAVSGDYNPIHLHPLSARMLGQKGMIAHGMYLAGRMLVGREPAGGGFTWQIAFATPVLLPGTVSVHVAHPEPGRTAVTAWDARRGRPHFTGSVTASTIGGV